MTQDIPSIFKQTWWRGGTFNFGNLTANNVRYFNPTVVTRPDGDWLIARHSVPFPLADIGMNDLEAFKIEGDYALTRRAKVRFPRRYKDEHFEDPRASVINGRVCISCTTFQLVKGQPFRGSHQLFSQVDDEWRVTRLTDPVYGLNGASPYVQLGSEKNWLWFEHDHKIHMVYTTIPHQVVLCDDAARPLLTHATHVVKSPWEHGTVRGGSPPVLVGDEYWSFFHSSLPWAGKKRRYHMGAYAFGAKPPFHITRMTRQPLLSGSQQDPWAHGLPLVVFPGGAIYRDGKWVVVFGVNDYVCGWIEIPHDELKALLEPVKSRDATGVVDVAGNPLYSNGRPMEERVMAV